MSEANRLTADVVSASKLEGDHEMFSIAPTTHHTISAGGLALAAEALDWLAWCKKQGIYTGPDGSSPYRCVAVRAALLRPLGGKP